MQAGAVHIFAQGIPEKGRKCSVELFNQGNLAAADEIVSETSVNHDAIIALNLHPVSDGQILGGRLNWNAPGLLQQSDVAPTPSTEPGTNRMV